MLYVLMGEDAPGKLDARMAVRPAHLARLEALRDEGRLLVAGPMPAIDSPDPVVFLEPKKLYWSKGPVDTSVRETLGHQETGNEVLDLERGRHHHGNLALRHGGAGLCELVLLTP